jgi:hypothetical protein
MEDEKMLRYKVWRGMHEEEAGEKATQYIGFMN